MIIIYENCHRSASNNPFVCTFLWSLCFMSLCEKCWYSEFFWSIFSCIQTKYWQMVCISLYSVQIWENTDQKKSKYRHFSCSVCFDLPFCSLLNTSLYSNNIESHTEKNNKYCLLCEALLIDGVFDNISQQYFG